VRGVSWNEDLNRLDVATYRFQFAKGPLPSNCVAVTTAFTGRVGSHRQIDQSGFSDYRGVNGKKLV